MNDEQIVDAIVEQWKTQREGLEPIEVLAVFGLEVHKILKAAGIPPRTKEKD